MPTFLNYERELRHLKCGLGSGPRYLEKWSFPCNIYYIHQAIQLKITGKIKACKKNY